MKSVFICLLSVVCLISCKKEIEELPEPTETGANTFGAKINGELWGPMKLLGAINSSNMLEARYYGNGSLKINASNYASSPNETEMEIYLHNVSELGTFQINQNTAKYPSATANYIYFVKRKFTPRNEWITSENYPGTVTITKLDIANKIVAGTFSFSALSMEAEKAPLEVTEGRFDVKLQ